MKVLLFGATGRVGSFALEYALAQGHAVTAVVRDPAKLRQSHSLLRKLAGDIYQPATLLQAIDPGFEVVLSCVGGNVMRPSTVVADSARLIVELMRQRAITRHIVHTGRYAGGYHRISPPDVADFLVTELTESRYPRQIVGIWS